jgi:nucleotide-binding universal stress UspA family protein
MPVVALSLGSVWRAPVCRTLIHVKGGRRVSGQCLGNPRAPADPAWPGQEEAIMGYKSILTIVTDIKTAAKSLQAAAAIARREKGHVDILCIGVDRTQASYYYAGANAVLLQQTLDRAREDAAALAEQVKEKMKGEEAPWSVETAVAQIAVFPRLVAERAWFADLVVLPHPYGEGRGIEDEAVIEAALFEGQAPVLIIPEAGLSEGFGKRAVIAWNESAEAMEAVRLALPMLVGADNVDIAIIDPPQHGPDRSDPGGRLSQMLTRHGCRAEISILAKTMPRVSDVIKRHATDQNADLVVMGAYGHSRFREAILGGATRNMLEKCEVPVLMAH